MKRHRLTTYDNPYDPFEEFPAWYSFDVMAGYHTTEYLARMVHSSYDLSELDQDEAEEQAIDEIIQENILGIYRKVSKEFPDSSEGAEAVMA